MRRAHQAISSRLTSTASAISSWDGVRAFGASYRELLACLTTKLHQIEVQPIHAEHPTARRADTQGRLIATGIGQRTPRTHPVGCSVYDPPARRDGGARAEH